jgi:hypothetical protein
MSKCEEEAWIKIGRTKELKEPCIFAGAKRRRNGRQSGAFDES